MSAFQAILERQRCTRIERDHKPQSTSPLISSVLATHTFGTGARPRSISTLPLKSFPIKDSVSATRPQMSRTLTDTRDRKLG